VSITRESGPAGSEFAKVPGSTLNKFANQLAQIVPTDSLERYLSATDISLGNFQLAARPIDSWFRALNLAQTSGKLDQFIEVISDERNDVPALQDIRHSLSGRTPPRQVDRPLPTTSPDGGQAWAADTVQQIARLYSELEALSTLMLAYRDAQDARSSSVLFIRAVRSLTDDQTSDRSARLSDARMAYTELLSDARSVIGNVDPPLTTIQPDDYISEREHAGDILRGILDRGGGISFRESGQLFAHAGNVGFFWRNAISELYGRAQGKIDSIKKIANRLARPEVTI
jgi:hypothetical protein